MNFLYLTQESTVAKETEGIILSPSLYWYTFLPLSSISRQKVERLADSAMSNRPDHYQTIHLVKGKDGYFCYAYDESKLLHTLSSNRQKCPIWFLQQLQPYTPFRIDSKTIAHTLNGVVVELPDSHQTLPDLHGVFSQASQKIEPAFFFPRTLHHTPGHLLALLILLLITGGMDIAEKVRDYLVLQKQAQTLHLSKSLYVTRSLVKKYRQVDTTQRTLRSKLIQTLSMGPIRKVECSITNGCRHEK